MLNPTFKAMQVPSTPQQPYFANNNMYVQSPGTIAQVQLSDIAALQALGWALVDQSATVRLKAPPEVLSASIGTNAYPVGLDGTITAFAYDSPLLLQAGFTVAS
jgi:hypothetical protein